MWEVDPETRSKLLEIQKKPGNNLCCDCGAPSPQWASPKFGIFICLTCAGTHRGLGVHISFVRSISMDAFKSVEIMRMDKGGNAAWKKFFEDHESTKMSGVGWEETTVADRYGGEAGEEWKERLTAAVEGKEWVPGEKPKATLKSSAASNRPSRTGSAAGSRSGTPLGVGRTKLGDSTSSLRSASPASSMGGGSRKTQNESYFAKLGNENATRPADLPPSQGGKYAGFGSSPFPEPGASGGGNGALPGLDDLQKDPVAALTKGFGWFTTTVGKGAKNLNDGFIQPTAQKLAEADIATQARLTAAQLGQTIQTNAKGTAEQFNRFVDSQGAGPGNARGRKNAPVDEDKRDFWDNFGEPEGSAAGAGGLAATKEKPSAIGTAAMRKNGPPEGKRGKEEGWEEDGWEKF